MSDDHGPQKSPASTGINHPPNPFFQFVYSWPMNGGQANLSFPAPGGIVQSGSMATLEKMFELILDTVRESQASLAIINAQAESTDREMLELIRKGPYVFWMCPVCVNPKIKLEHKTDGRYLAVCLECGRTNRDRPIAPTCAADLQ